MLVSSRNAELFEREIVVHWSFQAVDVLLEKNAM